MKSFFTSVIIFLTVTIFSCCINSHIGIIDKQTPIEEMFIFEIPNDFSIVMFDGDNVKWSKGTVILLPAGIHKISCYFANSKSIRGYNYEITWSGKPQYYTFTYDFKAGEKYTIVSSTLSSTITKDDFLETGIILTLVTGETYVYITSANYIQGKISKNLYVGREGHMGISLSYPHGLEVRYKDEPSIPPNPNYHNGYLYDYYGPYVPLAFCYQDGLALITKDINLNLLADLNIGTSFSMWDYNIGGHVIFYPVNRFGIGGGGGLYGAGVLIEDETKKNKEFDPIYYPYARGLISLKYQAKMDLFFDYFFYKAVFNNPPAFRVGIFIGS